MPVCFTVSVRVSDMKSKIFPCETYTAPMIYDTIVSKESNFLQVLLLTLRSK
jgi:hypothetical protein